MGDSSTIIFTVQIKHIKKFLKQLHNKMQRFGKEIEKTRANNSIYSNDKWKCRKVPIFHHVLHFLEVYLSAVGPCYSCLGSILAY